MTNVSQNSADFSPISISLVACNDKLAADIFLKIAGKFIKFKEQGDVIPEDKYNYFISRNVKELYVLNAFKDLFHAALRETKEARIENLVAVVGEENRDVVELQSAMKETIYEAFLDEELSNETVDLLKEQVEHFIGMAKEKNLGGDIFINLSSMNNTIAEHSMNVANLSVLFGLAVGQVNPIVLENLYLGALFHDYGKAKIPASVREKPNSVAYDKAIKGHPEAGAELLRKNPNIPQPVLTIVAEHHEQFGGMGFPKGISGNSIYGLTRIVSIANIFDNIVTDNRKNKAKMYSVAIKALELDKGKQFDPSLMPRILDTLKLSVGDFVRERKKKS